MSTPTAEYSLRQLEAHYASMLAKVRDLIQEVGGASNGRKAPEKAPLVERQIKLDGMRVDELMPTNGARITGEIARLSAFTKGDAAEIIFQERGYKPIHKRDLFEEMQRRGHPVKTLASLTSGLSGDYRFASLGDGLWRAVQPDLSVKNQAGKEAAS